MKKSSIELAKELLVIQMNHWFFVSLAVLAMGLFDSREPKFLLCLVLGILPVYGYFLRTKMKVFILFMALSVTPVIISFVVPAKDAYARAIMVLFSLFYSVYSIYLRTRTDDGLDTAVSPVVAFGVSGGLLLIMKGQIDEGWDKYFILCALVYFACFLVNYYFTQYLRFLKVNDSSAANIPERAMFETGLKQTLLFTGAVTAFLAIVANVEWLATLLAALKKAIVAFISKYLQFTPEQGPDLEYMGSRIENGAGDFFETTGEPALIWVILQYVAMVLVLVGLLFGICYGIYKGYKALASGFKRERKVKEQELSENDDVHEQVEIVRKERGKVKNVFEAFSVTERIRKTYRKRVEKECYTLVKDGELKVLNFFTAKECCDRMDAPGLKMAYEKARYSNANCTNEDLKAAKD